MQQIHAAQTNDTDALAQLAVCDVHGRILCDEQGVSIALHALYYGNSQLARQIVARCQTVDMFTAAATDDVVQLSREVAHHADGINAWSGDGFHALGLACFFGAAQTAAYCIAQGADVNRASNNQFTVAPIHSATAADSIAITRMLLEAGADANKRQQGGFCAIHTAAQHGNRDMCELLIAHGADIHLATDDGHTAAHIARNHHHTHLSDIL